MQEPRSISSDELSLDDAYQTDGIARSVLFSSEELHEDLDFHMVRSDVEGGEISDWHHHGDNHLFAYLISGDSIIEYGPDGYQQVTVEPGGAIHVPPRVVHRDVNPSEDVPQQAIAVIVGTGPSTVNVDGPGQ
jgi:uncharacterized RmlC-like cupin family protein